MSEEINKIIDNLEGCIGMFDYLITPIESNLLVSYIKELQQENQEVNNKIKELVKYAFGTDISLGEFKGFYKLATGKDYDPNNCLEVE